MPSESPRGNPLMNVQDRSGAFDLNKYGVGQPVRRTEDPVLVQGQGRYTDDLNLPGQAYAVFVRSRNGHGIIKGSTRPPRSDARRARDLYRRGSCRLRHAQMRRAVQEPRRLGDEEAGAPVAAERQGALRRRSGRGRGRRDAGAGERRGRSGRGRHRAAARRHQGERCRQARRAAALRRRARQRRARLSLRRSRQGRGGFLQGRARHQARR